LIKGDHSPGDRHNHYNHHTRGKKTNESSSLSLPEHQGIIKIIRFGRCGFRCRFEKGLQSIDIDIKSNWRHKTLNITTAADKCELKIKVPTPCPCVGDRRGSVSRSGSVMKVMKGLNFYISILPAYLNLRRAKEFDEIIIFLYFYLGLKGISTGDFSGVLRELFSFSIEDDQRESEIPIPYYRNLLMILKKTGLSNEPFRVIGGIGDCELGFRYDLAKESPQTRHQTCWLHRAVNANANVYVYVLDSMPESVQPLTLALTPKTIHEIYLSPTKDESLKVFGKFTEIFEAKYTESTTPPLTISISPISIYIYPVTAYMSQSRNLILTMTYNFGMFKWRVNPMDMIDCAKPLLIMIKSISTIGLEELPHPAPTLSFNALNRRSGKGWTRRGLGINHSTYFRYFFHLRFRALWLLLLSTRNHSRTHLV
jgi:hypothetical protein